MINEIHVTQRETNLLINRFVSLLFLEYTLDCYHFVDIFAIHKSIYSQLIAEANQVDGDKCLQLTKF